MRISEFHPVGRLMAARSAVSRPTRAAGWLTAAVVVFGMIAGSSGCAGRRVLMPDAQMKLTSNQDDTVFRVREAKIDQPAEAGWREVGRGREVGVTLSGNLRYEVAAAAPGYAEKRVPLTEPVPYWHFQFLQSDRRSVGGSGTSPMPSPPTTGGPYVEISFPAEGERVSEPVVVVVGQVRAEAGIARVEVRVNGRKVELERGLVKASVGAAVAPLRREVQLDPGPNEIVVSAFDAAGKATEVHRNVVQAVGRTAPSLAAASSGTVRRPRGYARRIAAVVGINDYVRWPALEGAVGDARRVRDTLRSLGFDEVVEIYDRDATRARILSLLGTELARKTSEDDLVVIYFAGHGQTETLPAGEKRGYIIPVDGDVDDVFATAISMQQLRDLSNRLRAKHVYYAMDSCYSGLGFVRSAPPPPTLGYLEKMMGLRTVQMIAAGLEGEAAIERGAQGIFTTHLLRALRGEADFNGDGAVTASEIGNYVRPQVSAATGQRQTPQFGTIEGSGEVVFFTAHEAGGS